MILLTILCIQEDEVQISQEILGCFVIVLLLEPVLIDRQLRERSPCRHTSATHADHVQTYHLGDDLVVVREHLLVWQGHEVSSDSATMYGNVESTMADQTFRQAYPLSVEPMTDCRMCWHSATSEGSIFVGNETFER